MLKRLAPVLLTLLVAACSKSSEPDDKDPPSIAINTPTDNQVFSAGQTVVIDGAVSDNNYISIIHIHIYNNNTAALLIDINRFPNGPSFNLGESFTAQAGIQYKIQIVAIDKAANEKIQTLYVTCN